MGFRELQETKGYQQFTALAYGLGASVVIIGALFKIMHWPGAGVVLTVGMLVEAFLFALSAFDKPHKEFNWALVYPVLASEDEEAVGSSASAKKDKEDERLPEIKQIRSSVDDEMSKLTSGIQRLNETAGQLNSLSSAAAVSDDYVVNMTKASSAAGEFAASQKSLKDSSDSLVSSYQDIAASIGSASQGSKNFASQIDGINKNISTINSVFELQVKSVNEQNEAMKTLASAVKTIEASLNGSAAEAEEYKKQVGILATQLKNLNSVYGNMLNAMTIKG